MTWSDASDKSMLAITAKLWSAALMHRFLIALPGVPIPLPRFRFLRSRTGGLWFSPQATRNDEHP